ncbi:MAG: energy-coupling factor transporter ATPase [Oscillospiraceae bacterium]|nr:energy-coupling factor transporter ATPase [Oscillospiraceae bacterium]
MPILKTEKLTHTYSIKTPFEHVAISDIDFEVSKGEYLGLIGATGSGKSTLIGHLNGLLKPTSGSVFYDGTSIHESKKRTREIRFKVGLVFQYPEYQLFEATVFEDIAFGPKNMGLQDSEVNERVLEAARFVDLDSSLLEKSPFELSGGEKRRAAIAGVIAMRPEVLILDEPTAGLDPRGQAQIMRNIAHYKDAYNTTVILVTHNMEEVARSVDRLVVLNKGSVFASGTPAEIFMSAEKLFELGLAPPKASMIASRLRSFGLATRPDIYTIEQLRQSLNLLRGGEQSGGDDNAS